LAVNGQQSNQTKWTPFKHAGFVLAVCLGARATGGMEGANPNLPGWLPTIAVATAIALVLAFALPWLVARMGNSLVILSDKGVNNNIVGRSVSIRFWPWDEIAFCTIANVSLNGESYRTFRLHGAQGQVLATFGVGSGPSVDQIEEMLRIHGKRLNAQAT
jgi:hypothetical protein